MQIEEQAQLSRVFQFKKIQNWQNKLTNKKLPALLIDERANVIECKDSDNEPTVQIQRLQITRAQNSLNIEYCVTYFETEILGVTEDDNINIGLMSRDSNTKQFLGKMNTSFGYQKGELYLNKKKVSVSTLTERLKIGDRIGVGINCYKRELFVTKNGDIVQSKIEIPGGWYDFYPAIGLSHQHEKVRVCFSINEFKYNIQGYADLIEHEIESQIKKQEVPNHQVYSLVHEYLSFNGYDATLNLLNQKKIQFHKLKRLAKNLAIPRPNITLESRDTGGIIKNEEEEIKQPHQLRNRILSQIIGDGETDKLQARRKNTEMLAEQNDLISPNRKGSLSWMSNAPISAQQDNKQFFYNQELQNEMIEPMNENETFLLNERLEVVRLIKQKRIEEAVAILEKTIPKIFNEIYLMAFMKAHIFLRMIKQESPMAAVEYSQKQKQCFQNHLSTIFPFYSSESGEIKWQPLKNIYCAIAYSIKSKTPFAYQDMLSDKQFQLFGNFVNSLILKQMGYLGSSRLTFLINNIKKMQEKLRDYKGMNCGIELSL